MKPIIYVSDGEKESRATLVDKIAHDVMNLKTEGKTSDSIIEIVSSSIVFTVMGNMKNEAPASHIADAVEDFLSAYALILFRSMGSGNRN